MRICNEVEKAIILESNCTQGFSLRSNLNVTRRPSSEILISDNVLLTEPVARFCLDWEFAVVLTMKLWVVKMRTLLTSVQIQCRKC